MNIRTIAIITVVFCSSLGFAWSKISNHYLRYAAAVITPLIISCMLFLIVMVPTWYHGGFSAEPEDAGIFYYLLGAETIVGLIISITAAYLFRLKTIKNREN